jgi:hypothetical protein
LHDLVRPSLRSRNGIGVVSLNFLLRDQRRCTREVRRLRAPRRAETLRHEEMAEPPHFFNDHRSAKMAGTLIICDTTKLNEFANAQHLI